MIAKGIPHPSPVRLARYLITGKANEQAELWQLRGFLADDIEQAFRSIQLISAATKCRNTFFHLSLRVRDEERLDRSQWEYAANRIERVLGLDDQPRALAFHKDLKTGSEHLHVAWARISLATLTAKPLPFFKTRLKTICRELEKAFGLAPVPNRRQSSIRFAPRKDEEEQARRLGLDIHDVRETIRACFERSDCGLSFQKALAAAEIILARGDQRDFIAIDRAGGIHALGKRILGLPAAEIRARLSDLPRDQVPTVEDARQALRSTRQPTIRLDAEPVAARPASAPADGAEGARLADTRTEIPTPSVGESVRDFVHPTAHGEDTEPIPRPSEAPTGPVNAVKNRQNSDGFAAALKRQFRAAVRALFKRTASPQPQTRRQRSGETAGTFRLAARSILRPIVRLPPVSHAVGFLNEVLPWLHLWEWNEIADHDSGGTPSAEDNHHSPHP